MKGKREDSCGELLRGITDRERMFLELVQDPVSRRGLLDRLQGLGLLSAFLEAENGTTQ